MKLRVVLTFELDHGKVIDITVAPFDDQQLYLGMDFLDKVRAFIVPYASTLFIMADRQAHAIPMKWDAEKKRVLPALQFSICLLYTSPSPRD